MKTKICILIAAFLVCQAGAGIQAQAEECIVPDHILEMSNEIGKEYNICPELLQSIAFQESRFQADAQNGNCTGLMQVNPACRSFSRIAGMLSVLSVSKEKQASAANPVCPYMGETSKRHCVAVPYSENTSLTSAAISSHLRAASGFSSATVWILPEKVQKSASASKDALPVTTRSASPIV